MLKAVKCAKKLKLQHLIIEGDNKSVADIMISNSLYVRCEDNLIIEEARYLLNTNTILHRFAGSYPAQAGFFTVR